MLVLGLHPLEDIAAARRSDRGGARGTEAFLDALTELAAKNPAAA
jgi:hypothetical protein